MANTDEPFKEGYLWFPPHGVLSQLKKSWQKRYCRLFKWSKHGVDRLEVFDGVEDQKLSTIASIIPLESCVKITEDAQKHQPNVFAVWTKTGVHHFSANSEQEMTEWICALQAVAFRDNASRQTIEEDNDLYCSSGDAGVFSVKLVPSDASVRCGLKEQPYTLVVTPVALQLRESDENDTLLLTWPYRFIRRYGYRAGRFTFEAGRKCASGEGVFHLEHSNQQEIFRCISSKMKSMKKLLSGEGSSSIICGNNQFRAALSMMARSRSPLPPSPTSTTPLLLDNDLSPISSTKPLMPLPSVPPTQSPPPPPLKPKPKTLSKKIPNILINEPTSDVREIKITPDAAYEDVQVRNDAWRTMGLDDPNLSDQSYASNTVVPIDECMENYDHLQHFGFISKTAPGYKQINPICSTVKQKPNIKTKTIMLPARKADDSHYGYGTINKKNSTEESRTSNSSLNSVAHNELQYAMIFKSNKV
ncbi:docking protein 2 [Daktulosphaira vitifoliae]|uniref:docking protein 2 n=1 Tax=Daktulosphaira vitifoliae TaxID=58002 RepID=UPI0021A9F9DB|nr:docking protein 2 [Daktulosphaira vitifoliae]